MSCVWMIGDIEKFICSSIKNDDEYWKSVVKIICDLKRFVGYFSKIECIENILEREINEMVVNGKFCEEMKCFLGLKEKVRDDLMVFLMCL